MQKEQLALREKLLLREREVPRPPPRFEAKPDGIKRFLVEFDFFLSFIFEERGPMTYVSGKHYITHE